MKTKQVIKPNLFLDFNAQGILEIHLASMDEVSLYDLKPLYGFFEGLMTLDKFPVHLHIQRFDLFATQVLIELTSKRFVPFFTSIAVIHREAYQKIQVEVMLSKLNSTCPLFLFANTLQATNWSVAIHRY